MKLRVTDLFDLQHSMAAEYVGGFTYPWEALAGIKDFIVRTGQTLPASEYEQVEAQVWVARDAKVFSSAYLGAPLIIDHEAEVRHCAFIRGSALVGKGAVIGNSVELKNALVFDAAQVPHYNYVGDSILGYKAHMGAGSITSNLKSDKSLVVVRGEGKELPTGLKKLGAILGDNVEIGCNSVLCPGSVIGAGTHVYPLSRVRGFIPANSIFKDAQSIVELIER